MNLMLLSHTLKMVNVMLYTFYYNKPNKRCPYPYLCEYVTLHGKEG